MRDATEVEKAYIAGIFDGEGCIEPPRGRFHSVTCATVNNTDVDLVNFLQEIYGGTVRLYGPRMHPQARPGRMCKPRFRWGLWKREHLVRFLNEILPYLRIKRKHVLTALKLCELVKRDRFTRSFGIPPEVLKRRLICVAYLKQLNEKGMKIPEV